jgi:hypothetical protein
MALAQVSIELMAIYFHSFEIFNIQIGEMIFCKADFIFIKSNYLQNAQKGQCFLDDFGTLVREIYVRGLRNVNKFSLGVGRNQKEADRNSIFFIFLSFTSVCSFANHY